MVLTHQSLWQLEGMIPPKSLHRHCKTRFFAFIFFLKSVGSFSCDFGTIVLICGCFSLTMNVFQVSTLLLLSQQEERHLLDRNVNAALERKIEELHRNLLQVTSLKRPSVRLLVSLQSSQCN